MQPRSDPQAASGARGARSERTHQELLSEVAHAFRTPLGVITGYAELLQLRDDPALRADALPRIEAAAARLAQSIDCLLAALEHEEGAVVERLLATSPLQARKPISSGTPFGRLHSGA